MIPQTLFQASPDCNQASKLDNTSKVSYLEDLSPVRLSESRLGDKMPVFYFPSDTSEKVIRVLLIYISWSKHFEYSVFYTVTVPASLLA